ALYHGVWSFIGVDPCTPSTRSDTYGRWVGEALRRSGVTVPGLSYGSFALPAALKAAFGCDSAKLTFEGGAATIEPGEVGPHRVAVSVSASAPGALVYRDAYHPGWKAIVDGVPSQVTDTPSGFKWVSLTAGDHRVLWEFEPVMNGTVLAALGV